ncbi:MAG: hypothetical protein FWF33_06965 [Clostridiales bacterium]|nr:hypothetical protein [Clostridiales bacterium]
MTKFMKNMFAIGAAIVLIGTAVFLVITYWDKILSALTASARVATNVLNQFSGDSIDSDDPSDYYDL